MTEDASLDVAILASGGHHKGAAVLINSLIANGFRGRVWIGYRGEAPPWRDLDLTGHGIEMTFLTVPGVEHIALAKPDFLLSIYAAGAGSGLLYLDADIVVAKPWSAFLNWSRHGLMVAQDCNEADMTPEHPRKRAWKKLAAEMNWPWHERSGYVNSGCLGVTGESQDFFETWRRVLQTIRDRGLAGANIKDEASDRSDPFHIPDQDALNMALHLTAHPIAMETPAAMGFTEPGNNLMLHAVFNPKPWDRHYGLKSILQGQPPTPADLAFWRYADGPIKAFSDAEVRRKRRRVTWCARFGRIIRSPYHYGFG